jgi:hypothetical protein
VTLPARGAAIILKGVVKRKGEFVPPVDPMRAGSESFAGSEVARSGRWLLITAQSLAQTWTEPRASLPR